MRGIAARWQVPRKVRWRRITNDDQAASELRGLWLRAEVKEPHGLSVTAAAARLHVTWARVGNLLGGRARLSADMAIRFEKAFGLSADTLVRMRGHDVSCLKI